MSQLLLQGVLPLIADVSSSSDVRDCLTSLIVVSVAIDVIVSIGLRRHRESSIGSDYET